MIHINKSNSPKLKKPSPIPNNGIGENKIMVQPNNTPKSVTPTKSSKISDMVSYLKTNKFSDDDLEYVSGDLPDIGNTQYQAIAEYILYTLDMTLSELKLILE